MCARSPFMCPAKRHRTKPASLICLVIRGCSCSVWKCLLLLLHLHLQWHTDLRPASDYPLGLQMIHCLQSWNEVPLDRLFVVVVVIARPTDTAVFICLASLSRLVRLAGQRTGTGDIAGCARLPGDDIAACRSRIATNSNDDDRRR